MEKLLLKLRLLSLLLSSAITFQYWKEYKEPVGGIYVIDSTKQYILLFKNNLKLIGEDSYLIVNVDNYLVNRIVNNPVNENYYAYNPYNYAFELIRKVDVK